MAYAMSKNGCVGLKVSTSLNNPLVRRFCVGMRISTFVIFEIDFRAHVICYMSFMI